MTNEEKILDILEKQGKTLENLQAGQERFEKTHQEQGVAIKQQGSTIVRLEQGLGQTNTALLQIKTVVETTEETVNSLDAGLKEVVKDHRERIEALEEEHRSNHKN